MNPITLTALVAASGALLLPAPAQNPAPQPSGGATTINWVAGRPVVRALVRGAVDYPCHLLVDLGLSSALVLHENAAGAVKTQTADVIAGDLTLSGLRVISDKDTWLEGFTRDHAEALNQVPLAGRIGRAAFAKLRLAIDGPAATLSVGLPPRPEPIAGQVVVDLLADPVRQGIAFAVTVDGVERRAKLVTEDATSIASPVVRPTWRGGRLDGVWLGAPPAQPQLGSPAPTTADGGDVGGIDLGSIVPFLRGPTPTSELEFGGPLLQHTRSILALDQGWLSVETVADQPFAAAESAFYAACGADDPEPLLRDFLADYPDSPFARNAATSLLQAAAGDPFAVSEAGINLLHSVPALERGRQALQLLDEWPTTPDWDRARRNLAEAALPLADGDEDGTAVLKLRRELGAMDLRDGNLDAARRHLLSAVFGMPDDGPSQLFMGSWHRARGEWERARARFFLAMLDPKATGEAGYRGVMEMHEQLEDQTPLKERLLEWAEGRVDALHPPRREDPSTDAADGDVAEDNAPSRRTVLVELFTGAHCGPCTAADMAFSGALEWFRADEVAFVQWHLPIPSPEPLVSGAAFQRGQDLGVRGTPTVRVDGQELSLGGTAADASDRFATLREAIEARLADAPDLPVLRGSATLDGDTVRITLQAADESAAKGTLHVVLVEKLMVYPGGNGQMFHHHVVRYSPTGARGASLDGSWSGAIDLAAVADELDQTLRTMETADRFGIRPIQPDPTDLAVIAWLSRAGRPEQAVQLEVHKL